MSATCAAVILRRPCAVVGAIWLACAAAMLRADDLDSLIGEIASHILDDTPVVTQAQFETRLAAVLKQTDAARRGKELENLVEILIRSKDIFLLPRDTAAFAEAAIAGVARPGLVAAAEKLLQAPEDIRFDVMGQSRLNLGIRFALATGGVPFERLKELHDRFRNVGWLDLEWLLPALGRAGGSEALPLIAAYRADSSITRLHHAQNMRPLPCAAVLAAAYAGDTNALEMTLAWYEQDVASRPVFAFQVSWGISQGMTPNYALLDYCGHRIAQAERLLDFLGTAYVPNLIERVDREALAALTGYLLGKLASAASGDLPSFLPLADHPCPLVKQRVLLTLFDRGDTVLRETAILKLEAWLAGPVGTDRLAAVETLGLLAPSRRDAMLDEAIAKERNPAVRRRMETLRAGGVW